MSETVHINKVIKMFKKRWRLVAIVTLSITLISGLLSYFVITPKYETNVKLFIGKQESTSNDYNQSDVSMYQNLIKTYGEIIITKDLISNAMRLNNISMETEKVLKNLTVTPRADTQILEVKFRGNDKLEIVNILNSIVKEFIYKSSSLIKNGNIQIIQNAEIPEKPVSPNAIMNIIIAFILGVLISIVFVFFIEYVDNTFKTSEDIEEYFNIAVIGVIPYENDKDK